MRFESIGRVFAPGWVVLILAFPSALLAGNIVDCPPLNNAAPVDRVPVSARGGLVFFSSLDDFEQAVGGSLPVEHFDGGSITEPGDGANGCVEPVSANSDDHCFSPGDLVDGFELTSTSGGGYAVLGDDNPQVGQDGIAVGPMNIVTEELSNVATYVDFTDDDVTAVALDAIPGCNGLNVNIQVRDRQDSLIGSTTISVDASWHSGFLGLISPVPVGRVELATSPSGGQLIQNLRFGPSLDWIFRDRFEP